MGKISKELEKAGERCMFIVNTDKLKGIVNGCGGRQNFSRITRTSAQCIQKALLNHEMSAKTIRSIVHYCNVQPEDFIVKKRDASAKQPTMAVEERVNVDRAKLRQMIQTAISNAYSDSFEEEETEQAS